MALRRRLINSSLLPENMGPQITSIHPTLPVMISIRTVQHGTKHAVNPVRRIPDRLTAPRNRLILAFRNRMSKTKIEYLMPGDDRDLYSGLIRLHVLHHAVREPIFGMGMVNELAHHGYRISPGTLYPLLHGLETKGYLRSTERSEEHTSELHSTDVP